MEQHEFDISIAADGTVRIETHGVKGPACEEYVKLFEEILAGQSTFERTAEYYEPVTDVIINTQRQTT